MHETEVGLTFEAGIVRAQNVLIKAKRVAMMSARSALTDTLFDTWLANQESKATRSTLRLLTEKSKSQTSAIETLRGIVPSHYHDPALIQKRLRKWGYQKTLAAIQANLPQSKKARSGDFGEILATEYVNQKLDFKVPIFKLRWRDHREMALRGDDILAVRVNAEGQVAFLKGEVKSRQTLTSDVVTQMADALLQHDGRPSPHTLNFVVNRLAELNEDVLYEALENYLTPTIIPPKRVAHLAFTVSGNDPATYLSDYVQSYKGTTSLIVVGVRLKDHAAFVKAVFDGVKLA